MTLDFTGAVISQPSLLIDADMSSGRLTLVTKPGIAVETDDVAADSSYVKVRAPRDSRSACHLADPGAGQGLRRAHHGPPAAPGLPALAAAASMTHTPASP